MKVTIEQVAAAPLGLTPGERLELVRRREHYSQADAAKLYGVTLNRYREWEAGRSRREIPHLRVEWLGLNEWCWLQRQRAGMRLQDLADESGLHVAWLHKVEMHGHTNDALAQLVAYWENRAAQ